ncbi:MAG: sigma-54 interaction domain-containing protein, partial [Candidatus Rifleibacteriota bacterium]
MLVRIGLGIGSDSRFRWLDSWLREKGAMLFAFSPENMMQMLFREPLDLVIFCEEFLGERAEELLRKITANPDSPAILLLTGNDRDDAGATFLAAGCEMVVPASTSSRVLREAIENLMQKRLEMQQLRPGPGFREPGIEDFVSESLAAQSFTRVARKVVASNSSLLILGETGVGKERLALAIHREGPRNRGPFIPINCAALPENLLESELFGHEQGAFTGAVRARRGAFELAHKGTIFLDEVGDMPIHLQSKLLRVLQDKEFQKIGGEKRIQVDVRVIAATNHDLQSDVDAGRFRRDLFYRLSVVNILIPPLRDRPEDIAPLIRKLIDQLPPRSAQNRRIVSDEATEAMIAYSWPGNVRELMNVLERAILLGDGQRIDIGDLPEEISLRNKKKICPAEAKADQHRLETASEFMD